MSLLDEIIDGASDDSVSTANLLRKVQVAAARLGATEIVRWTRFELNGYTSTETLPEYRQARDMIVQGTFSGPMRSWMKHGLPRPAVNPEFWTPWFQATFAQTVAELEALANGPEDSRFEWPAQVVTRYESTGTFRMQNHSLFGVEQIATTQMLRGLVDSIRNSALDFAVDLQLANPEAGSVGGPTVQSDAAVATVINNYHVTNNVTGHGTNIAAGKDIAQSSTVAVGDRDALRSELEKIGLDSGAADEFADALDADKSIEGGRVRDFLDRVRSGAIRIATDVGIKIATGQLVAVALEYLGGL